MSSDGQFRGFRHRGARQPAAIRRIAVLLVAALAAALTLSGALPGSPAQAYSVNTAAWTGTTGTTSSVTMPSGLVVTSTVSGGIVDHQAPGTFGATMGASSAMFTPAIPITTSGKAVNVSMTGCPNSGLCSNRGSWTLSFSQPVTNPVIHFAGFGGGQGDPTLATAVRALPVLTGSSPAGATLGAVSPGATNLNVTGGTTITATNFNGGVQCDNRVVSGYTSAAVAGCGSVPVVGTVTSLTFRIDARITPVAGGGSGSATQLDVFDFTVTTDEDFGDAPTSYDAGSAASNTVGDLHLGATEDVDNPTVANATTDPNAVAAGANNNGTNGDGADEDAFTTLPPVPTSSIGSAYSVSVPISGASRAGQVCGWIDFDKSGTFTTGAEQACAAFAAGATSVNLTWTVPPTSAGLTYARFRAAYGAVGGPTGREDSGEVEDYQLAIVPTVRVTKVLSAGSSGTFDLALNGSTFASGVGNGGTTGDRTVFNTNTYGAPDISVGQDPATTAVPITFAEANHAGNASTYTTTYSCVNAAGATVATGSATSAAVSIPASSGTNGTAQSIVCTFTNTQSPSIALVKSVAGTADVNGNGILDAGDTINYSFLVTNTGGTALTAAGVTDPKVTSISCPSATLALGASETCTGSHSITQADVDAGSVPNTAMASGTSGATVVTASSSVTKSIPQTPSLALQKNVASIADANADGVTDAGDKISWTFKVTNTGNVTVTTVAVADVKAGAISCPVTTLAPGASTTCTAGAYTITQAEGDAGVVNNTATATGKGPSAGTVTSNQSSTSTPLLRTPAIAVTKSAAVTDVNGNGKTDLGDSIQWSFLVKNTGNVTLTSIGINDPKAGAVSCPVSTLAPGATTTCTATTPYTITQADVDAGSVSNTATATGTPPVGGPVTSGPSTTTTPVARTSALQVTKSAVVTDANGDGLTDLGDSIQWSFLVKNTGTTTVTTVAVADPTAGTVSCPVTTLAPGASTTCTATSAHVVTQADVDNGVVSNTATASGQDPDGHAVTSNPSSTDTPVTQVGTLALLKTAAVADVNGDGVTDLGDTVTWSFKLTNTGTVTLHALVVTDPKAGPVSCPVTTLAPGASTTCSASAHVVTQADVDAGVVNNTATASALRPNGAAVPSNSSSTSTSVTQASGLQLTKTAAASDVNGDFLIDLGDSIQWSFLVKNTGTVTLTTIAVSDPTAGAVSCLVSMLAPGASTTCTATAPHPITQADVDAGHVNNTATASGRNPANATVTSNPSNTSTPVASSTSLSFTKSAAVTDLNGNGIHDLGDSIAWSFVVKNTGTATISSLAVSDPVAGSVTCPVSTLAPGASTTCTADSPHVISQTDVDHGVVSNTATAGGRGPSGTNVPSNPSSTDTPVAQTPRLSLTKSAVVNDVNGNGVTDLGDTIQWSFLVANSGTVTVTSVAIDDPKAGASNCLAATLAPGGSTICTATTAYRVGQVDVDAGSVTNTATATGTGPSSAPVTSNPSSTTTPIRQAPALKLTKSAAVADVDGNGQTDLGDTVSWSFLVENTGTTTLDPVVVSDPIGGPVTCPAGPLAPGASVTCTAAAHIVNQADVDAGVVHNTATASAKDPAQATVTSNPSSTSTPVVQRPSLRLTKSAVVNDVNGNGVTDLGDTVQWSFLVKNTGTTTITSLAVSDPTAGAVSCPVTTLAPGASTTCTTTTAHTISQADVDAGVVSNTATGSGTDPHGTAVPSNPSSTDTTVAQAPGLRLTKSAAVTDVNADGKTDLGDTIAWSFLVQNTGTTTISNLAVTDPTAGAVTCPVTTLAPGASTTCTATTAHTITQADVDAGVVSNTATAAGSDPKGDAVPSNPSSTDTTVAQAPALRLTKSAAVTDVNADGKTDLGDTIAWSFLVQNTGTTTISNLAVTDPTAGAVTCPVTTLAPGASTTCTATTAHTITQADVDAGVVSNTATAAGSDPKGDAVPSNPSSTDTTVAQAPGLTLTKSAAVTDVDGDGKTDLGDTITWSFLVQNTGTTTITNLAVSDPTAGAVTCPVTTLAPGASTTCTATTAHNITQADVDAGVVSNTATGSGTDPHGSTVPSNPSTTDTTVAQAPALQLTKSAAVTDINNDGRTDLGDTIAWSFQVQNTGTTTITGLAVSDPTAGPVTCPATTLAPGASTTCVATTPHTISQADVDAGMVSNTATAAGTEPKGTAVVSNPSTTDTPVAQAPGLKLTKSAAVTDLNNDGRTDLGDAVQWSFLVQNTGTTTLTNLTVSDPTAGPVTCPATTLAPGATTTCSATAPYTVTQGDVDTGSVNNTATAAATAPNGSTVPSNPSSTSTPVSQRPIPTLTKMAKVTDVNGNGRTDLGDTVTWGFKVENTGTVTLSIILVTDPTAGAVTCPTTVLAPASRWSARPRSTRSTRPTSTPGWSATPPSPPRSLRPVRRWSPTRRPRIRRWRRRRVCS